MKINSDFEFSDVKSKLDIVDVIGAYIIFRRRALITRASARSTMTAIPSMMVSKTRQTYHCFVCGEHGDVLDFLKKYNQITFPRLCEWLASSQMLNSPSRRLLRKRTQRINS